MARLGVRRVTTRNRNAAREGPRLRCQALSPRQAKRRHAKMEGSGRAPACIYHRAGKCSKGDACIFAHDADTPAPPCKFYKRGVCRYGSECLYTHQLDELHSAQEAHHQDSTPPPDTMKVRFHPGELITTVRDIDADCREREGE